MTDYTNLEELYREWNAKINVISRKDIDNIREHHVMHSLAIAEYLRRFYGEDGWKAGESVLDVGTGGGFPGIPLAMEFPELKFTLCDSIGKKILVARSVAEALGLQNVVCVNARAEAVPGEFDWVVSRAVTSLVNFYPWVKGRFRRSILCLKGGDVDAEIDEFCTRWHVGTGCVRKWSISEWLENDYFTEKFVIEIGKDYLCPPVFEKNKKIE